MVRLGLAQSSREGVGVWPFACAEKLSNHAVCNRKCNPKTALNSELIISDHLTPSAGKDSRLLGTSAWSDSLNRHSNSAGHDPIFLDVVPLLHPERSRLCWYSITTGPEHLTTHFTSFLNRFSCQVVLDKVFHLGLAQSSRGGGWQGLFEPRLMTQKFGSFMPQKKVSD